MTIGQWRNQSEYRQWPPGLRGRARTRAPLSGRIDAKSRSCAKGSDEGNRFARVRAHRIGGARSDRRSVSNADRYHPGDVVFGVLLLCHTLCTRAGYRERALDACAQLAKSRDIFSPWISRPSKLAGAFERRFPAIWVVLLGSRSGAIVFHSSAISPNDLARFALLIGGLRKTLEGTQRLDMRDFRFQIFRITDTSFESQKNSELIVLSTFWVYEAFIWNYVSIISDHKIGGIYNTKRFISHFGGRHRDSKFARGTIRSRNAVLDLKHARSNHIGHKYITNLLHFFHTVESGASNKFLRFVSHELAQLSPKKHQLSSSPEKSLHPLNSNRNFYIKFVLHKLCVLKTWCEIISKKKGQSLRGNNMQSGLARSWCMHVRYYMCASARECVCTAGTCVRCVHTYRSPYRFYPCGTFPCSTLNPSRRVLYRTVYRRYIASLPSPPPSLVVPLPPLSTLSLAPLLFRQDWILFG